MLLSDEKNNHGQDLPEDIDLRQLVYENQERLKELAAINDTTAIIKAGKSIPETLNEICQIMPAAWQYPEFTAVRILFEEMEFTSPGFVETQWKQEQWFDTIDNLRGTIAVFYLEKFDERDEGPFLREERNLILNLASLIEGYLNGVKGREGRYITRERLKELTAINQTTAILRTGKPPERHCTRYAWFYPRRGNIPNIPHAVLNMRMWK